MLGDRDLLIARMSCKLRHRVLRSGSVQNDHMHLFEMLQEGVKICEMEPTAPVIPALGNESGRYDKDDVHCKTKLRTRSPSKTLKAFGMKPRSPSKEEESLLYLMSECLWTHEVNVMHLGCRYRYGYTLKGPHEVIWRASRVDAAFEGASAPREG